MNHIKKKFSAEKILSEEEKINYNKKFETGSLDKKKKLSPDVVAILLTDNNKAIEAFYYSANGNNYYIPEPNPILIYFNNAYFSYKAVLKQKKELLKKLNAPKIDENISDDLYAYFGNCATFVIFLFTSVEAFVNKAIPDDYIYVTEDKKCTSSYNKAQIERHLSFDVKLKEVLNRLTKKNFKVSYEIKNQHFANLQEFRDMIIHTKTQQEGHTQYDHLFKKALSFEYEKTIHAVRDFINFYEGSDLIEECNCGRDI